MHCRPFWMILLLSVPLQACETLGLSEPGPDQATAFVGPTCPPTAVLSDAVTVTKLRPGTPAGLPDPANVAFTAEMSQAMLNCDYDARTNRLVVDIEFAIRGTRGPAAAGQDPGLDFFVAVVDVDNNVITKSVFRAEPVMQGRPANVFTQNVDGFTVPLAMDTRPTDYEILIGFQLTPDELAYNRIPRQPPAPRAQAR